MPDSATATHLGKTVTFSEADHSYRDDSGRYYASVTTTLKDYFAPFDADAIAARMEASGKGDAESIKSAWAVKRDAACRFGTRCHQIAEATLLGQPMPHTPETDQERAAFRAVWDHCANKILATPTCEILGVEKLVFSPRHAIAGTIDLVVRIGKVIYVLDWKTNERIDETGYNGAMCAAPISSLPDCNASKYALQLNIYERILREEKYIDENTEVQLALLWVSNGAVHYRQVPYLPMETDAVVNGVTTSTHAAPEGIMPFCHLVTTGALRRVNAIRDIALGAGWTPAALYANQGMYRYPCGPYGLVNFVGENEIGAITPQHIEIIAHHPGRTHVTTFANPTMLSKLTPEEYEAYNERAAIKEHMGGMSSAQAEAEALQEIE